MRSIPRRWLVAARKQTELAAVRGPHARSAPVRGRLLVARLMAAACVLEACGRRDPMATAREAALRDHSVTVTAECRRGFGGDITADIEIRNPTIYQVRDLAFTCDLFAKTGARIGGADKTIYEFVQPHRSLVVKKVSLGVADTDVSSCQCQLLDLKMAEVGGPRD